MELHAPVSIVALNCQRVINTKHEATWYPKSAVFVYGLEKRLFPCEILRPIFLQLRSVEDVPENAAKRQAK